MGELVSHRLGSVSFIGFLRGFFSQTPHRFPVLLDKVLYDGTHAGDHLTAEEIN